MNRENSIFEHRERNLSASFGKPSWRNSEGANSQLQDVREARVGRLQTLLCALERALRLFCASHLTLFLQFLKFGTAGAIGFVADTGVVYALRVSVGLYIAGIASYAVAVTLTWGINRVWTFNGAGNNTAMHSQWARYMIANLPGLLLNRLAYFALVSFSALCVAHPVIAVAAGSLSGMFCNFSLSRALVFR